MSAVYLLIIITSAMAGGLLLQRRGAKVRLPFATIGIAAVTFVVSVLAEFDPALLAALGRDRDALVAGEWWRLITPLFVQDGGWPGLIFNLAALLFLGGLFELAIGWRMLLVTYFAAGLVSEVAAYTVLQGQGFAGNSVANFGLAGFLAVMAVAQPFPARLIGAINLVGGVALLALADLHGVGYLVGALVGLGYVLLSRNARMSTSASSAAPRASGESSAGS